jgi:hypothetical protein
MRKSAFSRKFIAPLRVDLEQFSTIKGFGAVPARNTSGNGAQAGARATLSTARKQAPERPYQRALPRDSRPELTPKTPVDPGLLDHLWKSAKS